MVLEIHLCGFGSRFCRVIGSLARIVERALPSHLELSCTSIILSRGVKAEKPS
jgi:hypothetical protein